MPRKRRLTLNDLFRLKAITALSITPDGDQVVYAAKRADLKRNKNFSSLYLVSAIDGKGRRLTTGDHVDAAPRWSPAGDAIAFLSDRDKGSSIWLLPMTGGEMRRLTDRDLIVRAFDWSPDGRRIVFAARASSEREILQRDGKTRELEQRAAFRHVTRLWHRLDGEGWWNGNYVHLHVVDGSNGRTKQLTRARYDDNDPIYSPDGRWIAFSSNRADDPDQYLENADVYVIPARGGATRRITANRGAALAPSWSPDGRTIAYVGSLAGPGEDILHHHHIWTVPVGRKPARGRNLTPGVDNNCRNTTLGDVACTAFGTDRPRWSADGKQLLFFVSELGATRIYRTAIRHGAPQCVIGGDVAVQGCDLSSDGRSMAVIVGDALNPADVFICDPTTARTRTRRLTSVNAAVLNRIELAEPQRFRVRGSGGPIEGWLLKPPGMRGGRKHPALLEIHGGPQAQYGYGFFHELQWLAAQGYAVAYANPRGSDGYGLKWRTAIHKRWGDKDARDCTDVADWLARRPFVNARRLGVTGGSYGGYMTNWLIGHADRFKAAVTQRSVVNLESMYGTSDYGWDLGYAFGGTPWQRRAHYDRCSPLTYARRMHTPLLIIHAEQDYRCPIEQAEQLFTTLKMLGRTVELVRFEGESHGLSRGGRPQNRAERLRRIRDWFKRYL
ncbi:MAG: S9 family peptidase [Phycisphaerae bacterium]